MDDPGGTNARTMLVRAREFVTVDTYDMNMDITHAPAGTTFIPQVTIF